MTLKSWIAAVPVAAMATLSVGGCGGEKATLDTFAGNWHAHARTLKITRTGNGHERFTLGLGSGVVVELRFQLSRPTGTPHDATATAMVTAVRIADTDRDAFTAAHPPPRAGESFRLRLRDDVITEPLTGANYCGPGAEWPTGGCGA